MPFMAAYLTRSDVPPRRGGAERAARSPPLARCRGLCYHQPMTSLTSEQVRQLTAPLHLALSAADVDEVTHRLNAFLVALAPVADLPLASLDPVPAWLPSEANSAPAKKVEPSRPSPREERRPPDAAIIERSATE